LVSAEVECFKYPEVGSISIMITFTERSTKMYNMYSNPEG